jgi:hypothetical protein
MQRLCRITLPGLSISSDFTVARQRLLAEFPEIHEVVATTAPATLLLVYSGPPQADAWYDMLASSIAAGGATARRKASHRPRLTLGGSDFAA